MLWVFGFTISEQFVCLPTYPDLTTKYTSSNAFMYGSEYFSNEFGLGGGNDLPCFFQIYEKIRQTHISL